MTVASKRKQSLLNQKNLKEILSYNQNTGLFTWLQSNSNRIKIGEVAGCLDTDGYIKIRIKGEIYAAHRLAWLYMTGEWPNQVDHKDHVRNNNKWINLREVTHKENHKNSSLFKNNATGFSGVYKDKKAGKWYAQIKISGKNTHLGYFDSFELAVEARKKANIKHNYHTNHGVAL